MNTRSERSAGRGSRRRASLLVAAALAFIVIVGAVVGAAALGGSPSQADRGGSPPTVAPVEPLEVSPEPTRPAPDPESSPEPEPSQEPEPSPTEAPDPYALADGTYPTFIRGVDPGKATITVDVVQVFEGTAARVAAIQDGMDRRDARYTYLYLRNENDLLRTLPVDRDVSITLIGGCEAADRHLLLEKLADEITPYTEDFYYDVTLVDGEVDSIVQHLAFPAC